jgi:hypothetical protein
VRNFEQTYSRLHLKLRPPAGNQRDGIVVVPKKPDKYKAYIRYAMHCLETVPTLGDNDTRTINREMAAEWLKWRMTSSNR